MVCDRLPGAAEGHAQTLRLARDAVLLEASDYTFTCVCRLVARPLQIRKASQQDIQLASPCWYGAPFPRKSASLANEVVVKKCEEVRTTRLFLEEKRKPNPSMPSDDESPTIDVAFERPWDDILAERALLRHRRVA